MTRCGISYRDRSVRQAVTMRRLAITAFVMAGLVPMAAGFAEAPTTQPTSDRPIPGFEADDFKVTLEGIEGVSATMTDEQLLQVAIARVQGDRIDEGRKLLLYLLGKNRRDYYAISNLGFSFERESERVRADKSDPGSAEKADALLDKAAALFGEAGRLAFEARDMTTAEQVFSRVLLRRPADGPALLGLARVYGATNRPLQAVSQYRKYGDTLAGRDDAQAYLELGNLYLSDGRWRQAVDVLFKVRALTPNDVRVDVALAEAYRRGERWEEALAAAKAATQQEPNRAAYHRLYAAVILESNGSLDEALAEADRAVELGRQALENVTDSPQLLYELGSYYDVQERALTRVLQSKPTDDATRVRLARVIVEQSQTRHLYELHRALAMLAEAAAKPKPDVKVLTDMAAIQRDLGKLTEAGNTARRALEIAPSDSMAQSILDQLKAASK